jgi:hypothetical protein
MTPMSGAEGTRTPDPLYPWTRFSLSVVMRGTSTECVPTCRYETSLWFATRRLYAPPRGVSRGIDALNWTDSGHWQVIHGAPGLPRLLGQRSGIRCTMKAGAGQLWDRVTMSDPVRPEGNRTPRPRQPAAPTELVQ